MSTAEQVDGTSLATQRERCRRYLESQGWRPAGEYLDEGISGAAASRPALDRLMDDVRAGAVNAVVVSKLDRFGRSMRHLASLLGELDDRGVRFVSVAESFDSSTPSGRLQRNILGSFAEFEREQIRDRSRGGTLAVAQEGNWPGGPPPFGWRLVREARRTKLALEPEEAETLRLAVEMVAVEGLSVSEAAARLNALGRPTRKGMRWNRTSLRWMFTSSPIGGSWTYAPASGSRRRGGPGLASIEVPRIVSPEVEQALVMRLNALSTGRRPDAYPYLLSGRISTLCGDLYTGAASTKIGPSYRCRRRTAEPGSRLARHHASDPPCDCRRLPAPVVEPAVWEQVIALLCDPDRLQNLARDWASRSVAESRVESESIEAVDRKIARLRANMVSTVADYMRAGLPADVVNAAVAELNAELDQLETYRGRLAVVRADRGRNTDRAKRINQLASRAVETLTDSGPLLRREIAGLLDLRAELRSMRLCPSCQGSGKQSGAGFGRRCQTCWGIRYLPVLVMTGSVPERILSAGDIAPLATSGPSWPFEAEVGLAG